ncbi:hypothetical protein Tco_1478475 [Tanacetum coccineum]
MISTNITSPSFSLEQTNFVLEDWGTNPNNSSIEFNFHTCSVAMEANELGCGCRLELMFPGLPFSSCPTSGSLTWDSSGCLGWIVMALIELWMWVENCGSSFGYERADKTRIVPSFGFLTVTPPKMRYAAEYNDLGATS